MTKHNLQTHDFACLVQGLAHESKSEMKLAAFDAKIHKPAKPILAEIVREIEAAGRIDELITATTASWIEFDTNQQSDFIRQSFRKHGEQLLAIFQYRHEYIHYLIISALLNAKKKREDIKLYTFEQLWTHFSLSTPEKNEGTYNVGPMREVFLILKLFLEQDLLPIAFSQRSEAAAFDIQQLEITVGLLRLMVKRIENTDYTGRTTTKFLEQFTDFKAHNMFAELSKAEESHMYRWIMCGLLGLGFAVVIFFNSFVNSITAI